MNDPGAPVSYLDDLTAELDTRLVAADAQLAAEYPGSRAVRQPVHTVYVPADAYDAGTVRAWGRQAGDLVGEHCGTTSELARTFDLEPELSEEIYGKIAQKLDSEPIEDLRIDFEDGFGARGDKAEDAEITRTAGALAESIAAGTAAPFHGIRFKSFESPTRHRGLRTLALFVAELNRLGGLTDGFVLTLPKVTSTDQVAAMVTACVRIETENGLPPGRLGFEIQVETPQSILGSDGTALVARMIQTAAGRCTALHYGTYDYSASCGIAAAYQSMEHPAADYAKAVMQVAAAGTGVHLSDGSTNLIPKGNRAAVRAGWANHARLVRRSLERGYYQGWDLHPGHLPSRFVATYAFYREGFPQAAQRLRAYTGGGESEFMDEPATAVALAGFVLRGLECGAIDDDEVHTLIGISRADLAQLAKRPQ